MVKAKTLKGIAEETIAVDKKQKELDDYFEEIRLEDTLYEKASEGKFTYEFVMQYERYLIPALKKYFQDLGYQFTYILSGNHPLDKVLVILSWEAIE